MIEKQEINENETVTMTESLTVIGDIKSGAKIILRGKKPCTLIAQGEVHDNVEIHWIGEMNFEKNLGNNVKIKNHQGDITGKNLGQETFLTVHKGDISVGSTATGCKLINYSGNITVETLSESKIAAHLGDVAVTSFGNNNELSVYEGKVTIKKIESEDIKATIKVYKGDLLTSTDNAKHLKPSIYNGRIIDDEDQIPRPNLGR